MARPIPREAPVTSATRSGTRVPPRRGGPTALLGRELALDDLHAAVGAAGRADVVPQLEAPALRAADQGGQGDLLVRPAIAAAHRTHFSLGNRTHDASSPSGSRAGSVRGSTVAQQHAEHL